MNSAWPLVSAGLVMGAGGGLHCLTMCAGLQHMALRGIPIVTETACPGPTRKAGLRWPDRLWWHFQGGRLLGYSLLGLLAGTVGQQILAAAHWQPLFESLWAGMNALLIALGMNLLILGREPVWLALLGSRLFTSPAGRRSRPSAWWRGLMWAGLPCGLLYTALGTAILAATPLGAMAVMGAFAMGTSIGLFLMESGMRTLLSGRGAKISYRLNGMLLILLAAAGLAAALQGSAHPFC
ncbi:MAG: sulfite exporter TauE/SafE family protein [Lautropia sp.]|nr:sulfite exporter TauE/SafE family protein [Lautropia sp.]